MKEIAKRLREAKEEKEKLSEQVADIEARKQSYEYQLNYLMGINEIDVLHTDFGVLRRKPHRWAKLPEDPEARDALIENLKRKGLYDGLANIHATKFNSWLWKEVELARANGRPDPDELSILSVKETYTAGLFER